MAKTPKAETKWSPKTYRDPIDGKSDTDRGGSRDISSKIDRAQKADVMRGGSKRGKC